MLVISNCRLKIILRITYLTYCSASFSVLQSTITKNLKILKGWTEAVNLRLDNAMSKRKKTNNDLQNRTQKTKDWATRTSQKKPSGLPGCSERVRSVCSISDTILFYFCQLPLIKSHKVVCEETTISNIYSGIVHLILSKTIIYLIVVVFFGKVEHLEVKNSS